MSLAATALKLDQSALEVEQHTTVTVVSAELSAGPGVPLRLTLALAPAAWGTDSEGQPEAPRDPASSWAWPGLPIRIGLQSPIKADPRVLSTTPNQHYGTQVATGQVSAS